MDSRAEGPDFDIMFKYWAPIIEGECNSQFPVLQPRSTITHDMFYPIFAVEVSENLPRATTSPGPDEFTVRLWRRIPVEFLAGLFNLFIASGEFNLGLPYDICTEKRRSEVPRQLSSDFNHVRIHHQCPG